MKMFRNYSVLTADNILCDSKKPKRYIIDSQRYPLALHLILNEKMSLIAIKTNQPSEKNKKIKKNRLRQRFEGNHCRVP